MPSFAGSTERAWRPARLKRSVAAMHHVIFVWYWKSARLSPEERVDTAEPVCLCVRAPP